MKVTLTNHDDGLIFRYSLFDNTPSAGKFESGLNSLCSGIHSKELIVTEEFCRKLLERTKKVKEEWDKRVERAIAYAFGRLSIPTKRELDELKVRVEALERTLEKGQENKG